MYTDDDNFKKKRFNIQNSHDKSSIGEEDYYKDYYVPNVNDNNPNIDKTSNYSNNINYSNNTKLSEKPFSKNKDNLSNKKYLVIIIMLFIVLSILIVFLIQTINVNSPPIGITKNYIRLRNSELRLSTGDRQKLEVILLENDARDYKIEWFSNDDNIVSVDKNGNVIAINKGEAIILVAYYINNKVYDAQCRIYVS